MKEIHIAVRDRIARQTNRVAYLSGDGDFTAVFDLDEEWARYPVRTARFQTENSYTDVIFQGERCVIPVIPNAKRLEIGLYAGNVQTTTPASVALREGIRGTWGAPEDPTPNVFDQLMERLMDSGVELETLQDGVRLTVRYRGGASSAVLRHSEIYVGSGPMPEGYRIQLDPTTEPPVLRVKNLAGELIPLPAIRGEKGDKGDRGEPGPQGPRGDIGIHVVRNVNGILPEEDGTLRLTPTQLGALPLSGGAMTADLAMGGFRVTNLGAPKAEGDGANKAYVDSRRQVFTARLTTDWTGTGPYGQTLSLPEILESDCPHIGPAPEEGNEAEQHRAWGCVSFAKAQAGGIQFTCLEEKPWTAIPIQIEVTR